MPILPAATIDYGVPREPDDVQGAGVLQTVDAFHPVMLAIEGDVNVGATLYGLDVHTGTTLWSKPGVQLQPWRPFESYRPGGGGNGYSAMVFGDTVVTLLARGKVAGGCVDGRELAAFALTDGRLLWCSSTIPNGELTFIPVPDRQQVLLWDRNATAGVRVQALDVQTGRHVWTTTLPIDSADDWLRFVSYFTTTGFLGPRPTLVHGRYLGLVLGQFRKFGGSWRRMTVVVVDLVSGELRWQIEEDTHAGLIGPPKIWWTLNDRVVLVAVDTRLWAYDVNDGRRLWTARVDAPGLLEFAANGSAQVALVEPLGGTPGFTAMPSPQAKGLSALDLNTGKTLWTYRNGGRLGGHDRGTSTLIVSTRRQVKVLDAVSGIERLSFQSPLERDVQSARLVGDLIVLQSNNQLAAHDPASGKNVYVQTVSPPTRTVGQQVIGVLAFAGGGLIGAAIWDVVEERRLRLRATYPVAAADYAYFATGAGTRRRVVAVSSLSGQTQTIGFYARRKLGNLLNEPHGIMHSVSDREIQSYEYAVDPARHDEVHLAAEAGIARKTIERARAFAAEGQLRKAFGEAMTAIARLTATEMVGHSFTASLAQRQLSLAEAYEVAGELAPSDEKRDFTKQALSAYERLANSIREASSSEWGDWQQDLDRRIARIRTLLELR